MTEQYTVRIYDKRLVDRIENLYKKCRDIYTSKNPFFVECIVRGMDAIEKDLFGVDKTNNVSGLYDEIHLTMKKLDNLLKLCEKSAKETLANLNVNQRLLSSNYNMLLGLSEHNPRKTDFVESGMYDDLPQRLADILEDLLDQLFGE